MADEAKAKNFEFTKMISDWGGYNSARDRTNITANLMVRGSQNIYKKLLGTLAVRPGEKRQGEANTIQSPISSEFVWNTSWGATYTMVISNSHLYVVVDEVWYSLLSGLTATRYVFDKWWDNTEKKDRLLFVNGTDDMFHWSGGFATIASTTANTITKTGSTSWQQAGFSTTSGEKTIVINGTTYTYTGGESTTTLTGVTPDPSGEAVGSIVLQAVQVSTDTPAAGFMNDFIKVINNQVYVGSYVSRLCYISANDDFTNYTVPTPRAAGDPELLTLDATLQGIGVRQGKAHIGIGTSAWAIVSFADITVGTTLTQQTTVTVKPVALQQAPYAHEFIDSVGDNLIYLGQDQQVRSFGDFNNLFTSGYPSLSQEIATELDEEVFTGGSLRCIGEFMYVIAPNSGKVYLRQERTTVDFGGNIVAERLWHSPFIWNLTRIDSIDGVVVGFSNANPQIYQLWDTNQWHDDSPNPLTDLGTELVVNGTFDTDLSSWTVDVPGSWDWAAGRAENISQENFLTQGITLEVGKTYRMSFDFEAAPGGDFDITYGFGFGVSSNQQTTSGNVVGVQNISFDFTAQVGDFDGPQVTVGFYVNDFAGCFIDNVSLREATISSETEDLPYSAILALGYRNNGRRQGLLSFDKLYTEGYITPGTPLNVLINYDYLGSQAQIVAIINSIDQPAKLFTTVPLSMGDSSLGDNPLGDVTTSIINQESLPKFRVINSLGLNNCFEYQPIFYSDTVDAQWEIEATAGNETVEADQQPIFIINKRRNS